MIETWPTALNKQEKRIQGFWTFTTVEHAKMGGKANLSEVLSFTLISFYLGLQEDSRLASISVDIIFLAGAQNPHLSPPFLVQRSSGVIEMRQRDLFKWNCSRFCLLGIWSLDRITWLPEHCFSQIAPLCNCHIHGIWQAFEISFRYYLHYSRFYIF